MAGLGAGSQGLVSVERTRENLGKCYERLVSSPWQKSDGSRARVLRGGDEA